MRILKFDTVHPTQYILNKHVEIESDLDRMSRTDYLEWVLSLRSNYSDFYSYWLQQLGWEAEEFIINDPVYINKVSNEINSIPDKGLYAIKKKLALKLCGDKKNYEKNIIKKFIHIYNPSVIFVREHCSIESEFWSQFKKTSLVVSRIASPFPPKWTPQDFDLICTNVDTYRKVFKLNNVPSYNIPNGFDERLLVEIEINRKKYDVSFVGGLGDKLWRCRTELFEHLADRFDLFWWGFVKNGSSPLSENLQNAFQGYTSGKEMYQAYADSRIVVNDYPEVADGMAVNQRFMEVLGVGSFLLTREADNLSDCFPNDVFVTYSDEKDCSDKIRYYLKNSSEREDIAKRGQEFVLKNYSYRNIMKDMSVILHDHLQTMNPKR